MTITRDQLEKAAKAAGIEVHAVAWYDYDDDTEHEGLQTQNGQLWNPMHDRGQLLDLAMACKIVIDPHANGVRYYQYTGKYPRVRAKLSELAVNCQDFPALAEAVILAACEQFDAKGGE